MCPENEPIKFEAGERARPKKGKKELKGKNDQLFNCYIPYLVGFYYVSR